MKPAKRSQAKLVLAFREEIKLWKLSRDEDILVRVFVACLSERMNGHDPADLLTTGQRRPAHLGILIREDG